MTSQKYKLIGVSAIAVVIAYVLGVTFSKNAGSGPVASSSAPSPDPTHTALLRDFAALENAPVRLPQASEVDNSSQSERQTSATETIDGGIFDFLVRRAGEKVNLTFEEHGKMVEMLCFYQTTRAAFELSMATVNATSDRLEVKIPAYPTAGARLQELIQQRMAEIVGGERAGTVWADISGDLAGLFNHFGRGPQTIEAQIFSGSGADTVYQFRRSTTWRDASGTEVGSSGSSQVAAKNLDEMDYVYLSPYLKKLTLAPKS